MNILIKLVQKIKSPKRKYTQREASSGKRHDQTILFKALDRSLARGYHSVNWSKVGL